MKKGYYHDSQLRLDGWEYVCDLGKDIPTQDEIKAAAAQQNVSALDVGAWRMKNGSWSLYKKTNVGKKIHGRLGRPSNRR